jgi:gluconate kinase
MKSRDEVDEGSPYDDDDRDEWLRDNVPPHHS